MTLPSQPPPQPPARQAPRQPLGSTPSHRTGVARPDIQRLLLGARAYRVTLRLGDFDALFPDVATPDGRNQRLQAIGFLYEPLDSPRIAATADAAWAHFKDVTGASDDGAAREVLRTFAKAIVSSTSSGDGAIASGAESPPAGGGALPARGAFGRIRVPGTYCLNDADFHPVQFDHNPGGNRRHDQETAVWRANPSLGLIPLTALVELQSANGTWAPAPRAGTQVRLQLVPLSDGEVPSGAAAPGTGLRTTPINYNDGIEQFLFPGTPASYADWARQQATAAAAGDPQARNAPGRIGSSVTGGKRGNPATGTDKLASVLLTGTSRFHTEAHLTAVQAGTGPNEVAAATNADGEAGFILSPSWIGGDSYRLKAIVDPAAFPSVPAATAPEDLARAETGTLTVWRVVRVSRWLRWDYPLGAATPAAQVTNCGGPLEAIDWGQVRGELAKPWIEATIEAGAATVQPITQAMWVAAVQHAKTAYQACLALLAADGTAGGGADLGTLLPESSSDAAHANPTPGIVRFPSASIATMTEAQLRQLIAALDAVRIGMMESFTRGTLDPASPVAVNALSGLTVVQCPVTCSLAAEFAGANPFPATDVRAMLFNGVFATGVATPRRGVYVAGGATSYRDMAYPLWTNTLHEIGHALYSPHQYTQRADPSRSGAMIDELRGLYDQHDWKDYCLMGYLPCANDYCGRCALNHAGWNVGAIPPNHSGPTQIHTFLREERVRMSGRGAVRRAY